MVAQADGPKVVLREDVGRGDLLLLSPTASEGFCFRSAVLSAFLTAELAGLALAARLAAESRARVEAVAAREAELRCFC